MTKSGLKKLLLNPDKYRTLKAICDSLKSTNLLQKRKWFAEVKEYPDIRYGVYPLYIISAIIDEMEK